MGTEGNGEGAAGDLVLDAGALIAFERADRRTAAIIGDALEVGDEVVVPASALAQAWRGGPRSARLARLMTGIASDTLDEARAKEVGERLGSRARTDVADAHVVCCALDQGAIVLTADRGDIEALASADEHLVVVAV
ncbi:MAG TPA: hypothetical protein VHU14_05425 [Solirubrobacterales bacterium]|nr:hypothetical protein [Solirubrobacterales bacterium]